MFRGGSSGYVERVDVIGNKAFMQFVEQLEKDEELDLEIFELGKHKLVILTIQPDPAKRDNDIAIPVLSPLLARKRSLAEEIAALDVMALNCPTLPRKEGDEASQAFRYEGYDLVTLEKLVEREYTIPEAQTAQEVISYYAKRIAQDLKLPSQFAALAPKVRELLEKKAFGEPVNLDEPAMIKAIGTNVAQYVTIKTFAQALRTLVVEQLQPTLVNAGRRRSGTPPFPWSRPTRTASKTVFNLVPCPNNFEAIFAGFLEHAPDVKAFAKLPEQFGFVIQYTDSAANLRNYEPDFVVTTSDDGYHVVETKGLEDIDVAHKDRAAQIWCENATLLTGNAWSYLKIPQKEFEKLQPSAFADLAVFAPWGFIGASGHGEGAN